MHYLLDEYLCNELKIKKLSIYHYQFYFFIFEKSKIVFRMQPSKILNHSLENENRDTHIKGNIMVQNIFSKQDIEVIFFNG